MKRQGGKKGKKGARHEEDGREAGFFTSKGDVEIQGGRMWEWGLERGTDESNRLLQWDILIFTPATPNQSLLRIANATYSFVSPVSVHHDFFFTNSVMGRHVPMLLTHFHYLAF